MIEAFIVTLREGVEAALIVGITLAYLQKIGQGRLRRAVFAGLITAFAACLGEFGAIITFVSNIPGETRTLPLAIYSALQEPGGEMEAARLSIISIVLALIFMTLAEAAQRRMRR